LGSRIFFLVDSVSKSPEKFFLPFYFLQKLRYLIRGTNFLKHFQTFLIRSSVSRPPQRCYPCSNCSKWISQRRPRNSDSCGRRSLVIISMQDEESGHSFDKKRWHSEVFVHRVSEEHVQKIFNVGHLEIWVNDRETSRCSKCDCCKYRHLSDEFDG